MNKKRNKGSKQQHNKCDEVRQNKGFENRGLIDMEFDDEANGDRDIRKNGQTRLFHLNYRASCLIGIKASYNNSGVVQLEHDRISALEAAYGKYRGRRAKVRHSSR